MSDKQPNPLDETRNLDGTQPVNLPEWGSTTSGGHVQQQAARPDRRKRQKRDRSRSALYLPAWSVGLMLLLVFGITAAIVSLVLLLGGQTTRDVEPQFVIITAEPSATPEMVETAAPTSAPESTTQSFSPEVPIFALEGPTLPPIILSPTPPSVTVGATVIVNAENLRIRPQPSLDNTENFFALEGDRFTVIGGPEQGSGLTWWQVQDPLDPSRTGWAAADYLAVAIQ